MHAMQRYFDYKYVVDQQPSVLKDKCSHSIYQKAETLQTLKRPLCFEKKLKCIN